MKKYLKLSIASLTVLTIMGCTTTSEAPQVSPDGLQLQVSTRSTVGYIKEGVNFSDYSKIKISESQVSFKKDWKDDYNKDQRMLSSRVKDSDVIRIKADVAELFDEVFKEELGASKHNYLVEDIDSKTLILKPAIINLDVYAPDINSANRGNTYTRETGRATLFLEIYDGVSGEILARILDNEIVGDRTYTSWSTRVSNRADARRTIRKWAVSLRSKLDAQLTVK